MKDLMWDFDGTLFDTYPWMTKCFKRALQDMGIQEMENEVFRNIKISVKEAVEYYAGEYKIDAGMLAERYRLYQEDMDYETILPFPHALEVCEEVVKLGGRNFLITHRDTSSLRLLKHYKLLGLFSGEVTSEDGLKRKPDPEIFLHAIDKYNIKKDEALAVGDRELDILSAHNAGIKACLFENAPISLSCKPEYIIKSLDELLNIIRQGCSGKL